MTDEEILNMLRLPAFNKSYFARKLYGNHRERVTLFHQKLKDEWQHFDKNEMSRLHEIVREFAATPI